jgi:hypothetical protein
MKEKRKGPIGRAAELAEGVAATVRRMQREREPRVLVYDETGYARLVQPNGRGHDRLLETAEGMVALAATAEAAAKPRRIRRAEPEGEADAEPAGDAAEPKPRRSRRAAAGTEGAKPRRSEAKSRRSDAKPDRSEAKRRRSRPADGGAEGANPASSEPKPRRSRRAAPEDDA